LPQLTGDEKPDFKNPPSKERAPAVPAKSLRFQQKQLRNVLNGTMCPPENKKWTKAAIK
jgi:hypothetical protein